jgi:isopenicillin N synthase-like dioxygenase
MAFQGVPTIDLSGEPAEVAKRIKCACETVGFFTVVNHGVPSDVLSRAMLTTRGFFEQPLHTKMQVASQKKGYIPINGCDNAVRPTALHEKFSCSRVDGVDKTQAYYDPAGPNAEQAALYFGEDNRWQGGALSQNSYITEFDVCHTCIQRVQPPPRTPPAARARPRTPWPRWSGTS